MRLPPSLGIRGKKRFRGIALVLVLAVMILVALLVVGFFSVVSQDRAASDFYEAGSSARQMADTATGIVMAQIREATANSSEAWISQPGLLRTFSSAGPVAAYKLYSSDVMKVSGGYNPITEQATEIAADWNTRTNEYVDLNRPVIVRRENASGISQVTTNYPIVDLSSTNLVEGFSVGAGGPGVTATSPLPMPVRWIYVMKNGALATYGEASKPGAEAVGRVAFWTDDESCKVNINTASDGVFYDSPFADTKQDHLLANGQPVAQEYQRFPGHPAETSLASVLPSLKNITAAVTRSETASGITPRIGWGGSKGGVNTNAWWNTNAPVVPDVDRLLASTDELIFARGTNTHWVSSQKERVTSSLADDIDRSGFFVTANSRAPELNVFNRPRVTLWPFNKELIDAGGAGLTPEDRLLRFASEIGSNKRKLYFQRENAWDPFHDFRDISENQDLYGYLQWASRQPFPSASTVRAGSQSFLDKYTELGRNQILTQMFDYVRSAVNTANRSYEPVDSSLVYSFPRGHDLGNSGFNDITPILVPSGSEYTKGLGNGGVALNELILQFYNAGEQKVDEISPGKFKYVIRKVRLVVLADFWLTVNNLMSAMPRFQMRITGNTFEFRPNPLNQNMVSGTQVPIQIRKEGTTDWLPADVSTLDPMAGLAIGFPSAVDNVNVVCNNDAQMDGRWLSGSWDPTDIMGGSLGVGYGMVCPAVGQDGAPTPNARTPFGTIQSVGKTLFRATGYQYYPFVSDVIEFRIPLDQTTQVPVIEPMCQMVGSQIEIRIYPALKDSTSTTFVASNLHPTTGDDYLQKIAIDIGTFLFPLPKMGPDTENSDRSWPTTTYPKYSELTDYQKRLRFAKRDLVMQTPAKPEAKTGVTPVSNTSPMDTFRGYHLKASAGLGPGGDLRLAAARRDIPSSWYEANTATASHPTTYHGTTYFPENMITSSDMIYLNALTAGADVNVLRPKKSALLNNAAYAWQSGSRSASGPMSGAMRKSSAGGTVLGDWTNGYGWRGDGGLVQGPDLGGTTQDRGEGSPYYVTHVSRGGASDSASGSTAYFSNLTGLLFSPFKQIPSAVRFGTLPTRALGSDPGPWETLLFSPVPNGGKSTHRGWAELPRDHYWLDLFYMPVVEPYAITENLATAGKINLNQQIAPFTYLKRNTGLHALLRNQEIVAVPDGDIAKYKTGNRRESLATVPTAPYRLPIDVAETISQITDRFQANDPFVSASEICEIPMVPAGTTKGTVEAFWANKQITGDDKREMPYNHIYPRVTTRSNTYKVYYWAQDLKGKAGNWTVSGQIRGSQTIERFLNLETVQYGTSGGTAEDKFPALAGNDPVTGKPYYRFRTVEHKQFAP